MDLLVAKFLLEMVTRWIYELLEERGYCNSIDRYDEIDIELQGLEWAEEYLQDEICELEYHG